MNVRAVGCGTLAAVIFVAIGAIGIWRAMPPAECPDSLPYEPAAYEPVDGRTGQPSLEGVDEPLDPIGRASFGLASWEVWVEPGEAPQAAEEPLPRRIVLGCGDGSFQAYRRGSG